VTLIRPLNKGQGHSFWYQSISHIRLPILHSNFCSRTHRLATIHNVTDDRRHGVAIARPLVRSAENYNAFCDLLCDDNEIGRLGKQRLPDIKVVACPTVGLNNLKAHTWCTHLLHMYKKA